MIKKKISKEEKQRLALKRVMGNSFKQQQIDKREMAERTTDDLMNWNKENLSPNGGKKPFKKLKKDY